MLTPRHRVAVIPPTGHKIVARDKREVRWRAWRPWSPLDWFYLARTRRWASQNF